MTVKNYSSFTEVQIDVLNQIGEVANILWSKGWAERNAGNFSIEVSDLFERNTIFFDHNRCIKLEQEYVHLKNKVFLCSISGGRMRTLAKHVKENLLLLKISDDGKSYNYGNLDGNKSDSSPSSELPTHLSIHNQIAKEGRKDRVVLHAHVTEIINITHNTSYQGKEELNQMIWSMHPETATFIPEGVAFVPYSLPGTVNIADQTIQQMGNHPVIIWEKHGAISIAEDIDAAFDYLDIVAKSCKIWMDCQASSFSPDGLISKDIETIRDLARKIT